MVQKFLVHRLHASDLKYAYYWNVQILQYYLRMRKKSHKFKNMLILMSTLQDSIKLNVDIFFRWMIFDP